MENHIDELDYNAALLKLESFIAKGFDNLSHEDTLKLKALSLLVEQFETAKYPMPLKLE